MLGQTFKRGIQVVVRRVAACDGERDVVDIERAVQMRAQGAVARAARVRTLKEQSPLELRGTPAWAPDGESLVLAANHDGAPKLFKIPLNGSSLLVAEYSIDPVWSPDGRFLIYSGPDVGTTFPLRAAADDGRPYRLPSLILTRGARRVGFLHGTRELVILRGEIGHMDF